jgi:hypothetical protein
MDINEYARRKQRILTRMLAALLYVFEQFLRRFMTPRDWDQLMRVSYRIMKPYRDEGTELAREFYDSNRAAQAPDAPRHDIFTDDHYPERWYRETMLPVYQNLQRHGNAENAVEEAVARVTKVYEDAQRRTLIQGITEDTGQPIRGFARFDPKPPTCAFCTMMISRGPVYNKDKNGSTAGWPFDTQRLERLILDDDPDEINELMNKWHPKCTCIVVPVYKYDNYPSQAQEDDALKIYNKGRKKAIARARKENVKLTTRLILDEMRKVIYSSNKEQDEVTLGRNVA